jgi:hypothetical protein
MMDFGVKTAALAAFGEMPADGFLVVVAEPFGERKEGVKLGESTFNVFFWLLPVSASRTWLKMMSDSPLCLCMLNRSWLFNGMTEGASYPKSAAVTTAARKRPTLVFVPTLAVDCDIAAQGVFGCLCRPHQPVFHSVHALPTSSLEPWRRSGLLCILNILLGDSRHDHRSRRLTMAGGSSIRLGRLSATLTHIVGRYEIDGC